MWKFSLKDYLLILTISFIFLLPIEYNRILHKLFEFFQQQKL